MKIRPFGVEQWMNEWETRCEYNLAETCVESLTMQQLLAMSGNPAAELDDMQQLKMTYGAITGSERLRQLITEQYAGQTPENILITHGAIGANALVYATLVEAGDTVISVLPTYQQHYSIPESYGAEVRILPLREENGFLPDVAELRSLVDAKTKIIAINNPNNPSGALIDEALLQQIVEVAREAGAWLLCDEVYRGTNQQGDGYTAAVADLYEKGISTASMSKAYSLAGLRLGWIAAPHALLEEVELHRDYNTISVGVLDDFFACLALENRDKILQRKGVMFTPGEALDVEGYVRIGFANNGAVLKAGLERVSEFLRELAEERP